MSANMSLEGMGRALLLVPLELAVPLLGPRRRERQQLVELVFDQVLCLSVQLPELLQGVVAFLQVCGERQLWPQAVVDDCRRADRAARLNLNALDLHACPFA